jgi:RNA polymerase sigma-70 factor (ECF subfamily)
MTEKQDNNNFEMLFKLHFKPLCFFSNKYINDLDSAKNIVHDVFTNLWENKNKIEINENLKSYLYTSVYNRSLNYIRDNKKFVDSDLISENFVEEKEFIFEEITNLLEIQERIFATLDKLSPKAREAFELSRYENLKYKEIAEKLDISIKTVESHISKALSELRKNLKEFMTIFIAIINLLRNF